MYNISCDTKDRIGASLEHPVGLWLDRAPIRYSLACAFETEMAPEGSVFGFGPLRIRPIVGILLLKTISGIRVDAANTGMMTL